MPRSDIIAFAEKAQPGINLTKSNLVNHKKKHMLTTETSLKIIDIKKGAKENQDSDKGEESGLSDEQLLSLSTFLDLVIEKVNNRVKNGSLKPTVAEAVKAAEIKAKIKEASKFEKEMVKFFTEVSLKHGYSN
ncbi:MAG: hypothetical protein GY845_09405 [Planctomycetes bacterium]|nr:hypothetical protein [Planctomycetota bacterium]